MRYVLLALFVLVLIPAILDSNAQEQIEKGKDFDRQILSVNSDGTTSYLWKSKPERLLDYYNSDGDPVYVDFKINNQPDFISFESVHGSYIFNKQSCSFEIYDAGKFQLNQNPTAILSHIVKEARNGTDVWSSLEVNNNQCNFSFSQNENGIQIISKKDDSNWLFGTGGTFEVIYDIDYRWGFEWTYKYTNKDNSKTDQKYGFTFICDGSDCNIIKIDGQLLDVGDEVPKNGLMNKDIQIGKAKFDPKNDQHDYLWVLKHTEQNKMIVDFTHSKGRLEVGNTLTVDPTFGYTTSLGQTIRSNNGNCSASSGTTAAEALAGTDTSYCYRVVVYWDISGIPNTAVATNVNVRYDVVDLPYGSGKNCSWRSMEGNPSTMSAADEYTDAGNGSTFVSNDVNCVTIANNYVLDLGTTADADVTAELSLDDEWAVGITATSETLENKFTSFDTSGTENIELEVTYNLALNPPTSLSCDGRPFALFCSWIAPSPASTITGYYIATSLNNITFTNTTAIGNVTSYLHTNLGVNHSFYVRINATDGSQNSRSTNHVLATTDNYPTLPTSTYATVMSSTTIKYNWSNSTNNGGDTLDDYGLRCEVNQSGGWLNTVNNSTIQYNYNYTGLSSGDRVTCQVRLGNDVGWSNWSSNMTATTHEPTTGTVTFPLRNVGDIINGTATVTITAGSPEPISLTIARLQRNGSTIVTNSSVGISLDVGESATIRPLYYQVTDDNLYCYTVEVVASNSTGTVTLESSCVNITREYEPDYFDARVTSQGQVNYTESRTNSGTVSLLKVNRDMDGAKFQIECLYRDPDQAFQGSGGTWRNYTGVGYFAYNYTGLEGGKNYYIACWNDDLLFGGGISYAPVNATIAGIGALGDALGDFFGVNMFVFFVILIASLATGRSAPTFLIITAACAGILDLIGAFDLGNDIWSMLLVMTAIGVFAGKKFL